MKQKPMFAALLAGAISITTLGACGSGTPDQIEALSLRDINQPLAGAWVVLSGLPTTLAADELEARHQIAVDELSGETAPPETGDDFTLVDGPDGSQIVAESVNDPALIAAVPEGFEVATDPSTGDSVVATGSADSETVSAIAAAIAEDSALPTGSTISSQVSQDSIRLLYSIPYLSGSLKIMLSVYSAPDEFADVLAVQNLAADPYVAAGRTIRVASTESSTQVIWSDGAGVVLTIDAEGSLGATEIAQILNQVAVVESTAWVSAHTMAG